jgi:hypothetical protein
LGKKVFFSFYPFLIDREKLFCGKIEEKVFRKGRVGKFEKFFFLFFHDRVLGVIFLINQLTFPHFPIFFWNFELFFFVKEGDAKNVFGIKRR